MQLAISGIANGCVYGLIALGFVLIYKATEVINFAQGDMMMFGAFITLSLTNDNHMGLPFYVAVPVALIAMAIIGYLLDSSAQCSDLSPVLYGVMSHNHLSLHSRVKTYTLVA